MLTSLQLEFGTLAETTNRKINYKAAALPCDMSRGLLETH